MNGRVDILGPNLPDPFSLYDKIPVAQTTSYKDALQGNWTKSPLSCAFFSAENIQIIQNGIRAGVYKSSKGRYTVAPQNEDTLKIIMRSIFLQSAMNLPNNITAQIAALNKLVIDYAVPQVRGEAEGYIKYRNDVSTLAVPLSTPVYTSQKGQYPLELKPWF